MLYFLIIIIILFYLSSKQRETFQNSMDRCDYRNSREYDMVVIKQKNGSFINLDTGIHIKNIPVKNIESITIRGYGYMNLRIKQIENNKYINLFFVNYDDRLKHLFKSTSIIKGSDLPNGTIMEISTGCNKPFDGIYTNWFITSPCKKEVNGRCYYKKERYCTHRKPEFGGFKCIGPDRLKIECKC